MPPADNAANDKSTDREAKLAQALRANLRRRKASAPPAAVDPPAEKPASDG
jgi:hypothetical protein